MAAYTTPALVRGIVKVRTEVCPDDAALQVFIDVAHNMVRRVCLSSGYDDETLEIIERHLAAHGYAVRDRTLQRTSQAAGGVSDSFTLGLGEGLRSTQYGREAMFLDTGGNLAAADRRAASTVPKPGAVFLGQDDCE